MKLTVIVPTRNRWELLRDCLSSLLKQSRPADEIIVIDNGSSDGTEAGLRREFAGTVRRLYEPQAGIDRARNLGIREASGDIVAFTDDDCLIPPDWLAALAACFQDPEVGGAGGPILPEWAAPPPTWVTRSRKALGALGLSDLGSARRPIDPEREFLVGSNCAYRRELVTEPAGFQGVLHCPGVGICGEDYELSRRIARSHPVLYDPAARIRHRIGTGRLSLAHLMMRVFYYEAVRSRLGESLRPRRPVADILRREFTLSAAVVLGHLYGQFALALRRTS